MTLLTLILVGLSLLFAFSSFDGAKILAFIDRFRVEKEESRFGNDFEKKFGMFNPFEKDFLLLLENDSGDDAILDYFVQYRHRMSLLRINKNNFKILDLLSVRLTPEGRERFKEIAQSKTTPPGLINESTNTPGVLIEGIVKRQFNIEDGINEKQRNEIKTILYS